jgi:lysophospholipase L1-like esterase
MKKGNILPLVKSVWGCLLAVLLISGTGSASAQANATNVRKEKISLKFDFGNGKTAQGYTRVRVSDLYSRQPGYGFEPGAPIQETDRGGDALTGDFAVSESVFRFSAAVPEGNYRITVTLGDTGSESVATVKSERGRLMLENIKTPKGKTEKYTFTANVRFPVLSPGNAVKLDSREWNDATGAALTYTWDEKLTIQFMDSRPCVCAVEIESVDDAVTVFLIGDSTVTDQGGENAGSWGQMLPRWFGPEVVIANHAESGETMKAFRFQRRWDKVMDFIKPGDYVVMQFGHNDSKSSGHDAMWPENDKAGDWVSTHSEANTDYKWLLAVNAVEIKRRGGIPVIVSPITRISRTAGKADLASHGDYPKAAREAAELANCAFIDLNAMSVDVMNALGTVITPAAYTDGTHTSLYGGYLLSRCVVEGMKKANLNIVRYLRPDCDSFDPKNPKPAPEEFKVPAALPKARAEQQVFPENTIASF